MEENHERTTDTKKRKLSRKTVNGIMAIAGALVFLLLGVALSRMYFAPTNTSDLTNRQTPQNDGNKIVTQNEETISNLVNKVSPSVVSVLTTTAGRTIYGESTESSGAGTGIIVSADGYVLTNKHVVEGARKVTVVLSDGKRHENVEIVGSDPLNDVAFLKIKNVKDLPAAELGDSSSIRVGQEVVAIGNSLGLYQNTVTTGIVSGTGRPISAQNGDSVENLIDLIQTDAAINPGNSGGPLLNLAGQVIGINTAIAEDAQSIGFAIPINATKGILKGVLKGEGVARAYLGVMYVTITADVAEQFHLTATKGALVRGDDGKPAVVQGSPADAAGVRSGDIITKINGLEVGGIAGLSSMVAEYAPGDTIELTLLRSGNEQTVRVTLGEYAS